MFEQFKRFAAVLVLALASGTACGASGDLLWSFAAKGAIWGDVEVEGNTAYFGSDDGQLYALDINSRSLAWAFQTGGIVRSRPALQGSRVFISSDDGYLYAIDKRSGELSWRFDLRDGSAVRNLPSNDPPGDFDWGKSSPIVQGNRVFVGSAEGHLYALDVRSGKLLWQHRSGDRVRGAPAVAGKLVYFASWDKHIYALERDTGLLRWKQAVGDRIVSTPTIIGDRVIVGARDARIHAFDAKTGGKSWTYTHPDGSWVESTAVAADEGRSFYIGSSDALKLSKFDVSTGRELWSVPTPGWSWGTPTVAGGRVYFGSVGTANHSKSVRGGFFAIDAATGAKLWGYSPAEVDGYITGGVHSTPAVTQGLVLVGELDGHLRVFEE